MTLTKAPHSLGVHLINFSLGVHPSTLDFMCECTLPTRPHRLPLAKNSCLNDAVCTEERLWALDSMDGRSDDDLELVLCSERREKHRYYNARRIITGINGQNIS